jgi:hypothetical protein
VGLCLDGLRLGWPTKRGSGCICPAISIEDRQLHWTLVRSQIYYPKHILAYGSGKTCYSLVMGSGSFRIDCFGGLLGRRSKHHTEPGPVVLGAWSPSLEGDLDPLTWVEWVGLACAWGISEACVFLVPSWATLIRESMFLCDGITWLWSSTVVRTGTLEDGKMVLIAQPLLESSIGAYIEWLVNALMMTANKNLNLRMHL